MLVFLRRPPATTGCSWFASLTGSADGILFPARLLSPVDLQGEIHCGLYVIQQADSCQEVFVIHKAMPKKTGRPKVPRSKALKPGFSIRLRPEDHRTIR